MNIAVPAIPYRQRIPQEAIDDVIRQIVEKIHPNKIILFGSYARGDFNAESDVDLLIILDKIPEADKRPSLTLRRALKVPFGLDLIICTQDELSLRIKKEDWFLREAIETGKVVYVR